MAGFSQGGGVGLALANWMIEGDPGVDIWAMDVARYGDWASMAYTNAKVRENYSRRFSIRFPNEELPAGRPLKTTPIYDLLSAKGAQWGAAYGLEVPLWFAPEGVEGRVLVAPLERFRRMSRKEVKTVREGVGLVEISGFAKYRVTGAGRGSLARPDARLQAAEAGPHDAGADAEGGRQADRRFHAGQSRRRRLVPIAGSGIAEEYHMRWFEQHLPEDGSVTIEALGLKLARPVDRRAECARGAGRR